LRLRVLGTFELVGTSSGDQAGGGAAALMSSPRVRRLLAALTVHAGSVVSADRLADVVWGDAQPANIDGALHSLVSRLRAILRSAGSDPAHEEGIAVLTRPPGYLLRVGPDDLDARLFAELAARAKWVLSTEPAEAARLLDEALDLWRGPAYAEFVDENFARAEAARLEELRTTASEDRVEAALLLGRADAAVARLEAIVAAHPLRERPHAQLMLALYRTARQADALAVHRRYRERLDRELGLEPSADLQDLQTRMLRQDPTLDLPAPATEAGPGPEQRTAEPVPADPAPPAGNTPLLPRRLVGRQDDVARVTSTLGSARVVTLTGPGGVGKTSLAMHVAALAQEEGRFLDGIWVVELASVTAAEAVADAVTTVLSVQQQHGRDVLQRLVEYLRPKRLLLLLDNCEHVVEAAAEVADAVVRGCPHVVVLATSREPLCIDEEHVRPVAPLPLPSSLSVEPDLVGRSAAVALFMERATAAAPEFVLDERNAAAVGELCRRLDGLPLGIELAASRMRSMSPHDVVERLSAPLRFLRSASRMSAERHRTMRAVVDWSYGLLEPVERQVFDRLGVFAGAFSVQAATAVVSEGLDGSEALDVIDVADIVAGLVDKSMVTMVRGDSVGFPTTRYTLLETLRAFAQDRLEKADQTQTVRRAHATYHVDLAERAAEGLRGRDPVTWVAVIASAFDDLRATHAWALEHDPDLAVRLVAALVDYAETQMAPEVFVWADRTVDATSAGRSTQPLLTVVYAVAAGGARFSSDLERAQILADIGASLPDHGDPLRRFALNIHAEVSLFKGRLDDCEAAAGETERLALAAGDSFRSTTGGLLRALVHAYSGDQARALLIAQQIRDYADGTGHPFAMGWAHYGEAEVLIDEDPDRAGALLDEALARASAVGDRYLAGVTLVSAASLRVRHGDPERARSLFRDVIEHWHQAGNWTQQWTTLRNVIDLLVRLQRDHHAAVLHGAVTSRTNAAPVFGADAERLERARLVLTERLGQDAFASTTALGAALHDEEVVTRACAALDEDE
jgi:predicted ATPase/DNA-binding SARP family transcriptional activator